MANRGPDFIRPVGEGGVHINVRYLLLAAVGLVLLLWIAKGGPAYTVEADEEGVVLTFGRFSRIAQPGFHFKLPWPIQTVEKVRVSEVKRIEIGFRSRKGEEGTSYDTFMDTPDLIHEAQMLTGDENVVDVSMAVQYRIHNSLDYLFNFASAEEVDVTLRAVGEAALRQAVGDHPIDDVLTTGKLEVQSEIKAKMQELADLYRTGVSISEVQLQDVQPPSEVTAAFRDVATAREEREKIINEARAYQSEKLPMAEGQAEKVKQEAQGYKESRIAEAQGAVARFQAIAKQYDLAPEVTRTRLYLEAMSELLPKVRVTVVDKAAGIMNIKTLGGAAPEPPPLPSDEATAAPGPESAAMGGRS